MPDPTAVFGVAGFTVAICLIAIKILWSALQTERAKRDADQQAMLPALTQSTAAVQASALAMDRMSMRAERAGYGPAPPEGR